MYIFGHSSDFVAAKGNYKTVFALLTKAVPGDLVRVTNASGTPYTYLVRETKVISKRDTSVLAQNLSKKILTLQTSYPLGTALKRFIVIAELTSD